jgi:hypothetical protein
MEDIREEESLRYRYNPPNQIMWGRVAYRATVALLVAAWIILVWAGAMYAIEMFLFGATKLLHWIG